MSAEVLREAARLMRERAENATPGPWRLVPRDHGGPVVGSGDGPVLMGYARGARDVYYVASMHPDVALAVALLLDNEANAWESQDARVVSDDNFPDLSVNHARRDLLTAVARTYLGGLS